MEVRRHNKRWEAGISSPARDGGYIWITFGSMRKPTKAELAEVETQLWDQVSSDFEAQILELQKRAQVWRESRPDACSACGGTGAIKHYVRSLTQDLTCQRCWGTGQAP
jgi:hypothetical protein